VEECGHSSGLFFRVKSNIIILLYQGNGCFTYSPYLDTHGEIDIGLKKGKIQFLHPVRFDELRKQWLSHGFANIITRKIEAVSGEGVHEVVSVDSGGPALTHTLPSYFVLLPHIRSSIKEDG
jgi:E3 ubiquitin-protein ligase UBR1